MMVIFGEIAWTTTGNHVLVCRDSTSSNGPSHTFVPHLFLLVAQVDYDGSPKWVGKSVRSNKIMAG